jgi:hypothetical protein
MKDIEFLYFEIPSQVFDKDDSSIFAEEIDYIVPSTPA